MGSWACAAAARSPLGQDQPAVDSQAPAATEPPGTWLNPEWTGTPPADEASPGPSGLVRTVCPHYRSRYAGLGKPLKNTSWLNRPMYAGWFMGETFGGTLANGALELEPSLFTGFWLGYDVSHYWGSEVRLGLDYGDITYLPDGNADTSSRSVLADFTCFIIPGVIPAGVPTAPGLGIGSFHFDDPAGYRIAHTGLSVPLGFGVNTCAVIGGHASGRAGQRNFRRARAEHHSTTGR